MHDIFEAIDRCSFNALLLISSTGRNSGEFYKAMRGMIPGYKARKVSLKECPHVDPQRIADVEAKYGAQHPSSCHAPQRVHFEDEENRYFFTRERVDQLITHPPCLQRRDRPDPLLRLCRRELRERDRHAQGEPDLAL